MFRPSPSSAHRLGRLTQQHHFPTTLLRRQLISSGRDSSLDPGKEDTDSISQAKDSRGANPAAQHASVSGHQKPQNSSANSSQGGGEPSDTSDAAYGSAESVESPGLGSKHAEQGKKPGEEAVNPAVKAG